MTNEKREMLERRAALVESLSNVVSSEDRSEVQTRLGEVNKRLKELNIAEAQEAKARADAKKASGQAESQTNLQRAAHNAAKLVHNMKLPKVNDGPLGFGRMLLVRAKQARALIAKRTKATQSWPHVVEFRNHLDAFIDKQEKYLAAQVQASAEPQQSEASTESDWKTTWESSKP
jgi:hypothetical protein